MAVVPKTNADKIEFFEDHLEPWQANAVAIGMSAADVTDMTAKTTAARTAYEAQRSAANVAKASTEAYNTALEAMSAKGALLIKQVRVKADATNNPNVYVLAQIPAPVPPSAKGAPGTPYECKFSLNADGSLNLAWKCQNPTSGTIYMVYRSLTGSAGDFTYVGGTGQKKVTDHTIPAGANRLTYQIQGIRSNAVGAWATFNVGLGAGGVQSVTSVDATTPVRRAA